MDDSLYLSLVLFCIGILIIRYARPRIIFDTSGQCRPFGVGYDHDGHKKTLFHFAVVTLFVAMLAYAIAHQPWSG